MPERSHFDRAAPKDITLRFLIDKDELREEEEVNRSNGSTRKTIFTPRYDGQEHPFTMSGETKHKTHAVLWTRVDDRTIERKINHDNGLEYTTERLSVSPDGKTLTETHVGKRPDGTPYESVIVFQLNDANASNAGPISRAPALTGKMAIYNSLLGKYWTCTADVPAMSGQPPHTETDKVAFSIAPQNVLQIEVSSPQFEGRNFIGFNSKSGQYWRSEMGVFGGLMRETSPDGINFSGKSSMGGDWEPVRSVLTTVQPDGSSSDTEWWTRNGAELTFTSRCTREASMQDSITDWDEAELRAFMAELRKANIEGDVENAASAMADDYVQTDINGYRQDKTTWLNEYFKPLSDLIKAGKFHWDDYERTNLQFRFYGDCAVVTGELRARGTGAKFGPRHTWVADRNASFSGTLHFTHVYIKQNGKWVLAALHNQIPPQTANAAK